MGADRDSVVDLEFRVRGVIGPSVVDASVMPSTVSSDTIATVYAIAGAGGRVAHEGHPELGRVS